MPYFKESKGLAGDAKMQCVVNCTNIERFANIVLYEAESRGSNMSCDVRFPAGEQVIDTNYGIAAVQQCVAKM